MNIIPVSYQQYELKNIAWSKSPGVPARARRSRTLLLLDDIDSRRLWRPHPSRVLPSAAAAAVQSTLTLGLLLLLSSLLLLRGVPPRYRRRVPRRGHGAPLRRRARQSRGSGTLIVPRATSRPSPSPRRRRRRRGLQHAVQNARSFLRLALFSHVVVSRLLSLLVHWLLSSRDVPMTSHHCVICR